MTTEERLESLECELARSKLGDANLDDKVSLMDLDILGQNFDQSGLGWANGDFNSDGSVTQDDLDILASNWQAGVLPEPPPAPTISSMPEPATLGLLLVGSLALLSRRQ